MWQLYSTEQLLTGDGLETNTRHGTAHCPHRFEALQCRRVQHVVRLLHVCTQPKASNTGFTLL
eukprot:SAG11_NODE_13_length_26388_cov_67.360341_7_plen_63_part_00